MKRRMIVSLTALAVLAAPAAFAGTKYQANIVPATAAAPTLTNKSKLQLDDKGKALALLKGVDAGAGPVDTDGSWKTGSLTGDEYVVIAEGTFVALSAAFEMAIPVELKKGNGTTKLDTSALFLLIPPGLRSMALGEAEVWGPLGAGNAAACLATITAGFNLPPAPNPCRQGSKIGVAGLQIP